MKEKYVVLETFYIPKLNDLDVNENEEEFEILEGSIWESADVSGDRVYLTQPKGAWMDICIELFDLVFELRAEEEQQ